MDLEDWFAAQHRFARFMGCRLVVWRGCLVFEVAQ